MLLSSLQCSEATASCAPQQLSDFYLQLGSFFRLRSFSLPSALSLSLWSACLFSHQEGTQVRRCNSYQLSTSKGIHQEDTLSIMETIWVSKKPKHLSVQIPHLTWLVRLVSLLACSERGIGISGRTRLSLHYNSKSTSRSSVPSLDTVLCTLVAYLLYLSTHCWTHLLATNAGKLSDRCSCSEWTRHMCFLVYRGTSQQSVFSFFNQTQPLISSWSGLGLALA